MKSKKFIDVYFRNNARLVMHEQKKNFSTSPLIQKIASLKARLLQCGFSVQFRNVQFRKNDENEKR